MEVTSAPQVARESAPGLPDGRQRSALLALRPSLEEADLLVLVALVVLTAAFGPAFSLLAIDGRVLQLTEIAMVAALGLSIRRLGLRSSLRLLSTRLPWIALAVLWLSAAVGLARGLADFDPSELVYDVRHFEYSLLLPIVVLVVDSRRRLRALLEAMVFGGAAGIVLFGLTALSARAFDTTAWLSDQEGEIAMAGLYATMFGVWLTAKLATGRRPTKLEIALAGMGALLVGLTSKRAIWLAVLITLPVVAFSAAPGRRVRLALATVAVLVVGIGAAIGVETVLGEPVAKTATAEDSGSDGGGGGQAQAEIVGLAGGDSAEAANVRWRLAYWQELLERSAGQPILGAGFGPARFRWEGQMYDFRTGSNINANDVTGPHNAFISTLYLTGVVGLAALLAVIAFPLPAAYRTWRRTDAPERRLQLVTLGGILLAATGLAAFSEAFRAQFLAIFFWIPLGLLMVDRGLEGENERPADGPTAAA